MYDLMQHIYVDASIQSKRGMNEHKALVLMIGESEIPGNVIVIADRGYESFNNIAHFQERVGITLYVRRKPTVLNMNLLIVMNSIKKPSSPLRAEKRKIQWH